MADLVVVGTANAVKVAAVGAAFTRCGFDVDVHGVSVHSGVADQPMDAAATLAGARNRARAARDLRPDATFSVGCEGGLLTIGGLWLEAGWFSVIDRDGVESNAACTALPVPARALPALLAGRDMNDAFLDLTGIADIGHAGGFTAYITNDAIDRARVYSDAVAAASAGGCTPNSGSETATGRGRRRQRSTTRHGP